MGARGQALGLSRAGPATNPSTSGSASRLDAVLQAGIDRLGNLSLCETEMKRDRDNLKAEMEGKLEEQSDAPEDPPYKREGLDEYFESFFDGADPLVVETVFGLQVLSILGLVDARLSKNVAAILMEINEKEAKGGCSRPLEPASTGAPPVLDPSLENVSLLNLALRRTISRWGRLASAGAITSGTALSIAWFLQPKIYALMPSALINGIASSSALATLFTPQTSVLVLSLLTASAPVLLPLIGETSVIALQRTANYFLAWKASQAGELYKLYEGQRPGVKTPGIPLLVPIRNHYLCTLIRNLPNNDNGVAKQKYDGLQDAVLRSHIKLGEVWLRSWGKLRDLVTSNVITSDGTTAKWNQAYRGPSNFTLLTDPPIAVIKYVLNFDGQNKERVEANAQAMALISSCTNFHTILMWLYVLAMDRPNLRHLEVVKNGNEYLITYKPPVVTEPIDIYSKGFFTTVPPPVEVINRVRRISAEANIEPTYSEELDDAKTRKTTADQELAAATQALAAAEPVLAAAEEALVAADEALAAAEEADENAAADEPDEEAAGAVEAAAQQRSDAFTSAETAKQAVDEAKVAVDEAQQAVDDATNAMEEAIQEIIPTFGVYDNPDPDDQRCTYSPRPNNANPPNPDGSQFTTSLTEKYLWWTGETPPA